MKHHAIIGIVLSDEVEKAPMGKSVGLIYFRYYFTITLPVIHGCRIHK